MAVSVNVRIIKLIVVNLAWKKGELVNIANEIVFGQRLADLGRAVSDDAIARGWDVGFHFHCTRI